ncbi:MAG: hypothetical protein F6J93_27015 [Oscillatoria sp. SIO1A7]|nr:hypothetical protein [Oscillatoria sp. SIO1A7]
MLTDIDRQNLIEFGKQWKEAADNNKEQFENRFNDNIEEDLRQEFLGYFQRILEFVSLEDDGEIDQTEQDLIDWAEKFIAKVKNEGKINFNEEVALIKQGFGPIDWQGSDQDRQNLIEFGKQWKEAADNNKDLFQQRFNQFIEDDLRQDFVRYFQRVLEFVSIKDDGVIDQTEKDLIDWAEKFIAKVQSEGKINFYNEVALIKQGFDQG